MSSEPASPSHPSPTHSVIDSIRSIFRSRLLLTTLTARDLKARYRGSILGFFWSLANPLLLLAVYTAVFGFFMRSDMRPYPLFLFTGILPWTFFAGATLEAADSVATNGALIKKINFTAETLPLVVVLSHLVHFLLAIPILLGAIVVSVLFSDVAITASVALFPLLTVLLTLFVAGVSLSLSSIAVLFRDIKDIVSNLLNLAFFMTPIIYSLRSNIIPDEYKELAEILFRFNPMTPFVVSFQAIFFFGEPPRAIDWLLMLLYALISFTVGLVVFDRLRDQLAEAI